MSTPMMPEPAGQNLMMRPKQNLMMQPRPLAPQPMPASAAPPPPAAPASPELIKQAHTHVGAVINGLVGLVNRPKGDLSKKNVFDAASTMIAQGAFPNAESKQDLITKLAAMPDDEPGIRNAVGGLLMDVAGNRNRLIQAHGPAQ